MLKHVMIVILGVAFALTGCTSNPEPVEPVAPPSLDGGDASGGGSASNSGNYSPETIYFGFDDYTLSPKAQERLSHLAEYMKTNAAAVVQIEGHCDERGSNEYNLALGLKRAHAVQEFLNNLGFTTNRVQTISYGEEKPAVEGHGEDAWERNRRAEFIVTAQ